MCSAYAAAVHCTNTTHGDAAEQNAAAPIALLTIQRRSSEKICSASSSAYVLLYL